MLAGEEVGRVRNSSHDLSLLWTGGGAGGNASRDYAVDGNWKAE